jgi:hypothetical protein
MGAWSGTVTSSNGARRAERLSGVVPGLVPSRSREVLSGRDLSERSGGAVAAQPNGVAWWWYRPAVGGHA